MMFYCNQEESVEIKIVKIKIVRRRRDSMFKDRFAIIGYNKSKKNLASITNRIWYLPKTTMWLYASIRQQEIEKSILEKCCNL